MDEELQETVESLLGPGAQVVDCQRKFCLREEEVLLVNGTPIPLEGEDGAAIRQALLDGAMPPCDLLNRILIRAGILRAPVRLETSLSVKSSVVTREEVTVARGGRVVDERSRKTQEENFYESSSSEVWEPMGKTNKPGVWEKITTKTKQSPDLWERRSTPDIWEPSSDSSRAESTNRSTEEVWEEVPTKPANVEQKGGIRNNYYVPSTAIDYSRIPGNKRKGEEKFVPLRGGASSADEVDYTLRVGVKGMDINGDERVANGFAKVPGVQSTTSDPLLFDPTSPNQLAMLGAECMGRRSLQNTPSGSQDGACYNGAGPSYAPGLPPSRLHEAVLKQEGVMKHEGARKKEGPYKPQPAQELDHCLTYREGGNLVSGPLDALILHMVPTGAYYPDRAYLFAFLLSSRLFITPNDLISEVCGICEVQQRISDPDYEDRDDRFVPHLVQLLCEWTETFPYDFRDTRVMTQLQGITQQCADIDSAMGRVVETLIQNLKHRLHILETYEAFLATAEITAITRPAMMDVSEVCTQAQVLAQQLTHVELERLSYIGPEEFVQAFTKEPPAVDLDATVKKTRNLDSYVQWFNRLSFLVATQVVKHPKKKLRVKMVDFWVDTAHECFNIGNFNSLMAIISGLNMSPVSRLKKTWAKVQMDKFTALELHMDPSSNFSSYRSTLKAAVWRTVGATDERQRILIPFFSLLVKDLYFINEGCANKVSNGQLNFEKFWQLAKQVTEFITWKQVTCPFEMRTAVIKFLQTSTILAENALTFSSFECESPDNSTDKDRYKLLKAELHG